MENKNEFLTATDISKIVSISRQAVNEWLNDGRLKSFKVGNTRRIRPENFIEYLENLGNDSPAMANFKKNIANYLWQKYKDEKYLNEAKTQLDLIERYAKIKNTRPKNGNE